MTDALSLAGRLAQLDDGALGALIAQRVIGRTRIDDFFDLAEALLEPTAVQRALAPLDRDALAVLASIPGSYGTDLASLANHLAPHAAEHAAEDATGRLADRPAGEPTRPGLLPEALPAALELLSTALLIETDDDRFTAYPAVRDRLAGWPADGLPDAAALAREPEPAPRPADASLPISARDALAAERAFAAVAAAAELIAELEREPARELQKGGLSLPDARRLSASLSMSQQRVPVVLHIVERAGLVGRDGNLWMPTSAATPWLRLSTIERWTALALAWSDAQPGGIRKVLLMHARSPWGESLHTWLRWRYPAALADLDSSVTALARSAEELGVTVRDTPTTAGTLLLEDGAERAASELAEHFPREVDRVYLQHDLSVVAPGPLAPEIDTRMRRLADVESRALASSYRVTASSLTRAIAGGETAESLREFLSSISLTGIPQPLDYLVTDAASRFGRVRVRASSGDAAHSTIRAADEPVLGTIEVDQSLAALALIRDGDRLLSRLPRDIVYWALVDAGYPVAAEDESGAIQNVVGRRVAHAGYDGDDEPPAAIIVRRLRAAPDIGENSQAWLARQLDAAVRSHSTLQVSVAMPNGQEVEYTLEPTGLGGGRLRARDRASDIERTLPLTSIRTVRTI